MPDRDESDARDESLLIDRRRLLAAAGAGVLGASAGCQQSNPGTDAPTDRRTPSESPAPTADRTPTESPAPTADRTPTESPAPASTFGTVFGESPSSRFAPASGFGDLGWLDEVDPSVLKVTTLDGDGEGSLRWALTRPGPRIVVFEVGGVVDLAGEKVTVEESELFVAGQTAPSPGISVVRGAIDVDADDVVVQHVRVRPGDDLPSGSGGEGGAVDAMSVGTNRSNVVFDHCSVSWGSDENMSTGGRYDNTDVTFSNNVIAEGLSHTSLHPEEEHSKGTLIMDHASDTAVVGNVFLHNTDRHPRIKGGASCAVVNNFVYNFGEAIEMGGGPSEDAVGTIVGNYFHGGPATPDSEVMVKAEGHGASAYVAYNVIENAPLTRYNAKLTRLGERPLWPDGLETIAGSRVPEHNLATAGARPADRSPHDQRLITYASEKDGRIIDSQAEVGGYPELAATERPLAVPEEGLAEWLYRHTEAVELPDAEPP